jgi:hypothetical protein
MQVTINKVTLYAAAASIALLAAAPLAHAEHGTVNGVWQGNGCLVFDVWENVNGVDQDVQYALNTTGNAIGVGGAPISAIVMTGWIDELISAQATHMTIGFDPESPSLHSLSCTLGAGEPFAEYPQVMNINNPPDSQQ